MGKMIVKKGKSPRAQDATYSAGCVVNRAIAEAEEVLYGEIARLERLEDRVNEAIDKIDNPDKDREPLSRDEKDRLRLYQAWLDSIAEAAVAYEAYVDRMNGEGSTYPIDPIATCDLRNITAALKRFPDRRGKKKGGR